MLHFIRLGLAGLINQRDSFRIDRRRQPIAGKISRQCRYSKHDMNPFASESCKSFWRVKVAESMK